MNIKSTIAILLIALTLIGIAATVFVARQARAEVRQELIETQNNGMKQRANTDANRSVPVSIQELAPQQGVGPFCFCDMHFGG